MNALTVNPETGFLDAANTNAFGSDKKIQFLELAQEFKNQGTFPKVSTICDAVGVNITTFERHLQTDVNFKQAWQEISTHVEYQCISDLHELRKKNPMYMFGLLRYLNPSRWNPSDKSNTNLQINVFSESAREMVKYRDAEVVDNTKPSNVWPQI